MSYLPVGRRPRHVLADTAYRGEQVFEQLANCGTDVIVRKWIAEPSTGWIKNVLGFRQFSLRGLHRVSAERKLVCMASNLRRMATPSAS